MVESMIHVVMIEGSSPATTGTEKSLENRPD